MPEKKIDMKRLNLCSLPQTLAFPWNDALLQVWCLFCGCGSLWVFEMRFPLLWQVLAKETTGSCHTTCMFERRFGAFRRCQDRCEVFFTKPSIYKEQIWNWFTGESLLSFTKHVPSLTDIRQSWFCSGVVLGVNIEGGETQWSAMSVRPSYEEITEQSEAQRWIQNLCSRFDRASVASCLEISAQRLQQALDEARDNIHATQALDILGQEPVIWDHALHFLLRDPHEELCATVVYRSTRCKFERQLRLWGEVGDGSNHNQRYNLPTSGEPKELTLRFRVFDGVYLEPPLKYTCFQLVFAHPEMQFKYLKLVGGFF